MTLTEFLLARIAEDAARAEDVRAHLDERVPYREAPVAPMAWIQSSRVGSPLMLANFDYVLAECEAKRRIVAMADGSADFEEAMPRPGYAKSFHSPSVDVLIRVQQLLALPYADHPDFDPAWRL